MATHDLPILNSSVMPDSSGDCYPSTVDIEAAPTNAKGQACTVMKYPTGADVSLSLNFDIPQNYAGTPVLVIKGILNGTPANVLAFGAQQVAVADNESVNQAYETEDLANNSTWTGYADEDLYVETITLTPASAYQPGDTVFLKFYRDDSVDTTTFDFLLTGLFFRFSDS